MAVNSAMKCRRESKNKNAARCTESKHKPASIKGPSVRKPASALDRASKEKHIKPETILEKNGMTAMRDEEEICLESWAEQII